MRVWAQNNALWMCRCPGSTASSSQLSLFLDVAFDQQELPCPMPHPQPRVPVACQQPKPNDRLTWWCQHQPLFCKREPTGWHHPQSPVSQAEAGSCPHSTLHLAPHLPVLCPPCPLLGSTLHTSQAPGCLPQLCFSGTRSQKPSETWVHLPTVGQHAHPGDRHHAGRVPAGEQNLPVVLDRASDSMEPRGVCSVGVMSSVYFRELSGRRVRHC